MSKIELYILLLFICIALLLVVIGVGYLIRHNTREEKAERKWTDPKYHD